MTPFIVVAATAVDLKPNMFPLNEEVVALLKKAPGANRRAGWNTLRATAVYPLTYTIDGVRWGGDGNDTLELYSNGRLEFQCPLDARMCWHQTPEEYERQPSLAPIALIETIVSLVRLANVLWASQDAKGDTLFHVLMVGVHRFTLRPYSPGQHGWFMPGRIGTASQDTVNVREHAVLPVKDDAIGLALVRHVYSAFGLAPEVIPFLSNDENRFEWPTH